MQQLLQGLEHCHSHVASALEYLHSQCENPIVHCDLKPSNVLIDDEFIGHIGDFGLANFYGPRKRQPLTSRVVTLWYRPPELLLGSTDYGVAVDLWSAGCIVAELFSGKPIMPGRTEVHFMFFVYR